MFKKFPVRGRTLAILLGAIPLVVLFVFVVFRSGPLASTAVTVVSPEKKTITPAIFGIGTIEARRTYKIGPIAAGRLTRSWAEQRCLQWGGETSPIYQNRVLGEFVDDEELGVIPASWVDFAVTRHEAALEEPDEVDEEMMADAT